MSDDMNAEGVTGGDDQAESERLMAELRDMARLHDPVPVEALAAARSAIAWRTIDAELAELTADSSVEPELAGVRGAGTPTLLTFDAQDLSVEIEVLDQPDGTRQLVGQLVPSEAATLELRHRGGTVSARADSLGRFTAGGVMPGPMSLRCQVRGQVVATDWFLA